jgi:integrase
VPTRESSETDVRSKAEQKLRAKLGDVARGDFNARAGRVTIEQLVRLVESNYKTRKLATLEDVEYRNKNHIVPKLGNIPAQKFGDPQIDRYIEERREAGASEASINRELSIIRRGFTLGLRTKPPMFHGAPPHIVILKEDNVRKGFINQEQYEKILPHMPDQLRALFVVAWHTGMRLGELREIRWDWVDLDAEEIRIPPERTKNKKGRTVPIIGEMITALQLQKINSEGDWAGVPLVFHYHGKMIGQNPKGWKKAVVTAGFPNLMIHDLRRSAIRMMKRAGLSDDVAMRFSGHLRRDVFDRYNITDEGDMRDARLKLNAKLQEGRKAPSVSTPQ